MGIYPDIKRGPETRNDDGTFSWLETRREPGVVRTRTVTAGPWHEERYDCYCCSCGEYDSDPFCRNHGFAGERPCEVHNMPGNFDPEMGVSEMPESVQAHNAKRKDSEL